MNSGESRTRLSSALQWLIPRAQKILRGLIFVQQRTVWAISLLIAANIVLVSTWIAIASTKAVVETKLFSSGLLPQLSTLAIIAWLLRDIRNWLVTRIGLCLCNFKDAVTQLYRCRPWDAVQCQPDPETAKEKPKWHVVALLSLLWLVWLSLAVSSATEHVARVSSWLPATWLPAADWLPYAWLVATTCLLAVPPAQWKKRRIVLLLCLLWLLLAVSFAAELDWLPAAWSSHVLSAIEWLLPPGWLRSAWTVVTAFLLVVSLPAQRNKRQPSTDRNETNERPVMMTLRNYGRNAINLIVTVLLTWMLTLAYLVVSVGLTLAWIGYNVTKDDAQRDKITNSVNSLLQSHFPRYLFEEGTVFSLLYEKGDTADMSGICPTGDNLEWLRLFKSAVGQCTPRADTGAVPQDTSRERPQIEVSGLASVGPGHRDEDVDPDSAALLNLRIANMRTVSLAAVLLAEGTPSTLDSAERNCLCGSSFSDRSVADTLTAHCAGAKDGNPDHPIKLDEGKRFDVSYTLWSTYGMMHKNAPVNDEGTPADSVLEFLNRTVQITIQNDVCRY